MKLEIRKGDKYNRFTIISESEKKNGKRRFLCKCICGTEKVVLLFNLRNGNTKSCGCIQREAIKKKCTTHGMKKTRSYNSWCAMKQRCNYKKSNAYPNYGGRGIKVDWQSFQDFVTDMGHPPKGMSIDRIDNNGNYCKKNCRWATTKEQSRNKRSSIIYKGKCLIQWCEDLGLKYGTVQARIKTCGRSIERALELDLKL